MSAIPLDGIDTDSGGADLNGFSGTPWLTPNLPPPPSAGPNVHAGPPQFAPGLPPMAQSQYSPGPPTAVDVGRSVAFAPRNYVAEPPAIGEAPSSAPIPQEDGHSLGLALILVGVGAGVGTKYAGAYGGLAGSLYGGSAVNLIRAARMMVRGNTEADREAVISATYGVLGSGLASYILWKASEKKRA